MWSELMIFYSWNKSNGQDPNNHTFYYLMPHNHTLLPMLLWHLLLFEILLDLHLFSRSEILIGWYTKTSRQARSEERRVGEECSIVGMLYESRPAKSDE